MHNLRKLVIHNYVLNIKKGIKKHWYELLNLPLVFNLIFVENCVGQKCECLGIKLVTGLCVDTCILI